jgi:hypothetical protein
MEGVINMSQFRRLQGGRGMWQPPKETEEVEKPHVGNFLRSIKLTPRGPDVIESFGKAFSASLPLTSPPPAPRPQRHTLGDWWARVRTDLAVLPLYNVNWIELAKLAFDLDALDDESSWELLQEYGKKIALLRETFNAGDLYPPRA